MYESRCLAPEYKEIFSFLGHENDERAGLPLKQPRTSNVN